jgi:hypothetical protein
MTKNLILAAMLALATLGFAGCATHSHEHAGKTCDGSCCKDAAACAKCCTDAAGCAKCCKK